MADSNEKQALHLNGAMIEHYKELNATQRHYDTQLWLVPCLAYAILSVMYGVAYSDNLKHENVKIAILALTALVQLGLLLKMLNELAYQDKNRVFLNATRRHLGIDGTLAELINEEANRRSKWSRIYERIKAHWYVVALMALTFLFLFGNFIFEMLSRI